jgi:hypothetical protein
LGFEETLTDLPARVLRGTQEIDGIEMTAELIQGCSDVGARSAMRMTKFKASFRLLAKHELMELASLFLDNMRNTLQVFVCFLELHVLLNGPEPSRRVGYRHIAGEPMAFLQDLMNLMGWSSAPARQRTEA